MARRSSRLEKDRLEAALEELCDDQPDEAVRVVGNMIHGHEKNAGVDPNFAGLLHDKLAEKVDGPEPSGLRAPCVTGVLSAEELAALDDDEVDDSAKVVIDTKSHGVIDQVDSKLVTELNKKLCEEAAHTHEKPSEGFSADLSAALEKKLGGKEKVKPNGHGTIDAINNDLIAAVERKLGHQTTSGELEQDDITTVSGLRAPQCTVKLSDEVIAALDDDDDDEETKPLLATHGAIDNINDSLVLELQRKLANAGEETEDSCTAAELSAPEPVGFRAPHNTMKLDPDMIKALDFGDEDEPYHSHGAIDGIDSKLVAELQQKLEIDPDDEDHVDTKPLRGCRAPQPTQKLTQDMLAGLHLEDDMEELTVAPPPTVTGASITEVAAKLAQSQETDGKRLSGQFDPSFAAELQNKLADNKEDHGGSTGLRAPEPTKLLSSDMLANLDDDEEEQKEQTGMLVTDAVAALQALPVRSMSESSMSVQGQQSEDMAVRQKKPKRTISFRNSCGTDQEFAANLAKKLGEGMPNISETDDGVVQSGTRAPHTTTNLTDATLDEVWDGDEEETERKFEGGRIAPQSTQVLSAELLAAVDDDDTEPVISQLADFDDTEPVVDSGMKAPQCTAVLSIDQLAGLDEDNEQQVQPDPITPIPTVPSVAPVAPVAPPGVPVAPIAPVAPSTAETDFAAKVIQNMRDLPNGNSKSLNSSCKLRLAWLSDDEVQKENDSLRREIASLRAQIEMHRKEACFART